MSQSRMWVCLLVAGFVLTGLSYAATPDRIAGSIESSARVVLAKSLHPRAQQQYDLGAVEGSFKLGYMTLMTTPSASQQKALDQLTARQQDPSSSYYHKWLTPAQYADQFGLSQNDISRITEWLKSQGFVIQGVGGGRNTVSFSGTAAQVQNTFYTEIHRYRVAGVEHYANSTPISMPQALKGIVTGIRGLHDFRARPLNVQRSHSNYTFQVAGGGTEYFMAPGDVATLYDINPLYSASPAIDGTGQKLAVVGETDIYLADINNFRSGFGLSQISGCTSNTNSVITACNTTNFRYVLVGTDTTGLPNSIQDDLAEADLDVEWSGATARNAQIIYVNAPDPNGGGVLAALEAAINPQSGAVLAPVVTMSYGSCEAEADETMESELQQGASEGITILNSSGDTGAAACDEGPPSNTPNPPFAAAENGLSVSYPASSQWVTGVGGTAVPYADMFTNPSNYWGPTTGSFGGSALSTLIGQEVAWNDDEALAELCLQNPTLTFCTPSPGVPVTSAQTFQEDYWISIGGGGASNCFTATAANPPICVAGEPQPTWQQKLSISGAPAGVRYVPDVSMMASPNLPGYIFCTQLSEFNDGAAGSGSTCGSGGTAGITNALSLQNPSVIGGTSVATPVFAGIVTLLNQYLGSTSTGLGSINSKLYGLAATPSNGVFHQTDSGDNNVYCQPQTPAGQPAGLICPSTGVFGFSASNKDVTTGYNLVTGLGSVDADKLAIAWNGSSSGSFSLSAQSGTLSVAQGQTTGPVNMTVSTNFLVSSGSGQQTALPITYTCSGLPTESTCYFNGTANTITSQLTSVTLTIQTAAPTSKLERPLHRGSRIFYAMLLPGLLGIVVTAGSRRRVTAGVRVLGLILVLGFSTIWMASCGGSSNGSNRNPGTPVGSSTVTVKATTSGPSSSLQFTLSVTAAQ